MAGRRVRRVFRVVRAGAAPAVLLLLTLLPGSALAATPTPPKVDGILWTYPGSSPGGATALSFRYHDKASPLLHFFLHVDGSTPTTYQWTNLAVTVNGAAIANSCLPVTVGDTAGDVECQFPPGTVTDGATITFSSDAAPTIPENTDGVLFLLAVPNQGASIPITGPQIAMSPKALRAAILKKESAEHSVHYVTHNSLPGNRWQFVADVARDRGVQRFTASRGGKTGHATFLVVNSTAYLRGDAFALRELDFASWFVHRYAGKWVSAHRGSPLHEPLAIDVTIGSATMDHVARSPLSLVTGTIGGTAMRGLSGKAPEGGVITTFVPYAGQPLPTQSIRANRRDTVYTTFSRWNEAVHVRAPANSVRYH